MTSTRDDDPILTTKERQERETFLRHLHLLPAETKPGRGRVDNEFEPLLLIRAPALQITKWAAGLVSSLGLTASAALAAMGTWVGNLDTGERIAFIGAAAILLSAVAVAVAWVVVTDIQARSMLTRQKYEARAEIANRYLQVANGNHHPATPRVKPLEQADVSKA